MQSANPAMKREDLSVPSDTDVDRQLEKIFRDARFQGDKRSGLLRHLIGLKRSGLFDRSPKPTGKSTTFGFYKAYYSSLPDFKGRIPEDEDDTEAEGKNLIHDLAEALKSYYADPKNAGDAVHVSIRTGKNSGYEPLISWNVNQALLHDHLITPDGIPARGVKIYPNWNDFAELLDTITKADGDDQTDVRILTIAFTGGVAPEDKLRELAERGLQVKVLFSNPVTAKPVVHIRNLIRARYRDGETPEDALKALISQINRLEKLKKGLQGSNVQGGLEYALSGLLPYGFVIHSPQFVILGLFWATSSYGAGPMIYISADQNQEFANAVKREWDERWRFAVEEESNHSSSAIADLHSRESLAAQVVSDKGLMETIEAKIADGSDVWIASPDLSNVADETSKFCDLVRRVVKENVMRGISYRYICPIGWPGEARIHTLTECCRDRPQSLHIHQVPGDKFLEITLVPTHFITFNPLDPNPTVYMQLPLTQSQKGWLKIPRKDASRVVSKLAQFIADFPSKHAQ